MQTAAIWMAGAVLMLVAPAALAQDKPVPTLPIESSCEVDLNGDKTPDIALVAETSRGFEVIVLLRKGRGYSTFLVHHGKQRMSLSCRLGKKIETKGKSVTTNGTYLRLEKRGIPFVAYYWTRRTFRDVWMAE